MAALESRNWSLLPEHIVVHIFSYLTLSDRYHASLTCKLWHECFHSPYLWAKVSFQFYCPQHKRYLKCLNKYGHLVKSVHISLDQRDESNRNNACSVVETLATIDKRRLSHFTIRFTGENPFFYAGLEFVEKLKVLFGPPPENVQPAAQLTKVDLSGLSVAYDDQVLDLLADNNTGLESLNIQNKNLVCKVTPACMLHVVRKCRSLKDLHVFHCSLSDEVLHVLADENKQLAHLSIMCRREEKYGRELSEESWRVLARKLPHLRVRLAFDHTCPLDKVAEIMKPEIPVSDLRLETFTRIYYEVNLAVVYYKDTLEKLVLHTRNSQELNEALVNMAAHCTRLKTMYVYCVIYEETVEKILRLCPQMQERGTYILKSLPEPEPWVVGVEEEFW